ncbi:MAG: hypothetical protein GY880_24940, partial [Planctomycetaceae bacterium]|nr:hypothetical protein [Planctomycetaceae bacterium]
MPVEYYWDIETVQETADVGSEVFSLEITGNDTADDLGEYMPECVIDAINEAVDSLSEYEYSRLCLVRSHVVRGKVVEVARAYIVDAALPPMFIIDGDMGFTHDVPPRYEMELAEF